MQHKRHDGSTTKTNTDRRAKPTSGKKASTTYLDGAKRTHDLAAAPPCSTALRSRGQAVHVEGGQKQQQQQQQQQHQTRRARRALAERQTVAADSAGPSTQASREDILTCMSGPVGDAGEYAPVVLRRRGARRSSKALVGGSSAPAVVPTAFGVSAVTCGRKPHLTSSSPTTTLLRLSSLPAARPEERVFSPTLPSYMPARSPSPLRPGLLRTG
ncbi:hypothetical protein P154DRAFT_577911 [Amniculicola lignicola CBS 123094]|uniref:Uncharacterized protein n=1 Tax=Amniculicola lignicola CBS 123094 TaxID=1392246 RepID=A0A6A5WBR6_9PLEO|nr:hypothetical protein P154DRAFT_577911 [Amniculicola lignicola CBS 123094]